MEKAKSEKEAHGEFEGECPGYRGAQDTFYVGKYRGAGALSADLDRHLQQVAFAKPYDRKTPITAAELLNDRVVSFFEAHGIHVKSPLLHPTRAPCRRARAGGRDQHGFLLR
ncbi:hypothetical protein IVB26_07325 [Bradyrhizobium sp. 195]|nr:hypothetical protein IVB26_07325 [Bradyrhizobium sp. 195]